MNPFYRLYQYFESKKLLLVLLLVTLIASLLFVISNIKLEEDISKLIPQTEETKTLNEVLRNTDFSDKIVVNISVQTDGEIDDLTSYASELIDSLQTHCSEYILNIQGKIPDEDISQTLDFIYDNLPLFLEEEDYQYLENQLQSDSIKFVVESNYKTLVSPSGMVAKTMIRKDPFGLSYIALKKLDALKISDSFDIYNGFIVANNKQNVLLFIKPALPSNDTDANKLFVQKLYDFAGGLDTKYKSKASSEYYGSTVIAASNASQIKKDIQYTVSIALTVLLIILILFYKRVFVPILLFIPTALGALVAIASLYFLRDSISAISLGIGSILLGITLDYSLHILTHFRNNNDVKQLYRDVAKPILMSSLTTATAFICLLLLKSQALQDLGIFAAISVAATSVFALVLIPVLYKPKEQTKKSNNIIEKIGAYKYSKNYLLLGLCGILLVVSLFKFDEVYFNQDLNNMNYQSDETLLAEQHLDELLNLSSKSVYLVAYGDDLNTVLTANSEIEKLLQEEEQSANILQYSSNGSIVLSGSDQKSKLERWSQFFNEKRIEQVSEELIFAGSEIGFKPNTYQSFFNLIDKQFSAISLEDYEKVNAFSTSEFISDNSELKTAVSLVKINESQKSELQLKIDEIPNALLIDRKAVSETFLGGLKADFSKLVKYSFLAVFIILLLFYRNIELTLITATPIALTWLLTLGMMGALGIEFTIFNVIISTFIFGLGVDYSIFITNGLVKDYTYSTKELKTYKVSIILSVITTVLGVGVLIFAKHPALKSISVLCLTGILITVFVAFTVQPLLFRIFISGRAKKGFSPISLRLFISSCISLVVYSLGGVLLSLFSITLLQILPISKKIKNKILLRLTTFLVRATLYSNPLVKKRNVNPLKEDFKKPAIIIANHASSLDTLTMGLLTSNIIYLVNDWVYKSPIFGILARVLGFYPVSDGVDNSMEHLKEKVDQGFCLVVFPEAKRSLTNKVGRFHKGAFFLQEQLQIDILPIYIHGNSESMPKNDFMIHNGILTMTVGERITYNDTSFGINARERTKKISKFYKSEFLKLRESLEGVEYFKRILFSNYIFKTDGLLAKISSDFNVNKQIYHTLNNVIPIKGKILHLADDYGQIDILLVSKFLDRKIVSVIADMSKYEIAANCYVIQSRKVNYVRSLGDINPEDFEVLLISDSNQLINDEGLRGFEKVFVIKNIIEPLKLINLGFELGSDIDTVQYFKKIAE